MPYDARREDDGSYSIKGVPVFAEVAKGVKGAPFKIDQAWLQDAVENSKTRAREGYLPPVHFEHHGGNDQCFKAGHYRLTGVRKMRIGGKSVYAIVADLVKLDKPVFDQIMANNWPYRSVEIASYTDREIESIALLDDDTPFHKFELLNADSIALDPSQGQLETEPLGAVAFANTERRTSVALFHFGGDPQMQVKITFNRETGKFDATDENGEALKGDLAGASFDVDTKTIPFKKGAKMMEDDKDSDELPEDEAELKKMAKTIDGKLAKLMKGKKKKLCEDGDESGDKPNKPSEVEDKGMKARALDVESMARFDSMESEIRTLKSVNAEAASAKKRETLVDDTVSALRADNYFVSKRTIASFAVYAESGEDVLEQVVADYRRLTRRDGADTLDDHEDAAPNEDADVLKFAKQGEHAQRAAIDAKAKFDGLVDCGWKSESDRVSFMKREMAHQGFKATA